MYMMKRRSLSDFEKEAEIYCKADNDRRIADCIKKYNRKIFWMEQALKSNPNDEWIEVSEYEAKDILSIRKKRAFFVVLGLCIIFWYIFIKFFWNIEFFCFIFFMSPLYLIFFDIFTCGMDVYNMTNYQSNKEVFFVNRKSLEYSLKRYKKDLSDLKESAKET